MDRPQTPPARHPYDFEWQIARGVAAVIGAVLFTVAGAKMAGIHSESSVFGGGESTAEVFYQGMGIVSYGFAVVCLLLGLPTRLAPADRSDATPTTPRTAREPAVESIARCPECDKPIGPQNLAGHLVIAHGLAEDDARALAGTLG